VPADANGGGDRFPRGAHGPARNILWMTQGKIIWHRPFRLGFTLRYRGGVLVSGINCHPYCG